MPLAQVFGSWIGLAVLVLVALVAGIASRGWHGNGPNSSRADGRHLWFGGGGLTFAVLGLLARQWTIAVLGACLTVYAFGVLAVKRHRRS